MLDQSVRFENFNSTVRLLIISYHTQILQEICFIRSVAVNYLGETAAISLGARHSDLQAASNVFSLPVGNVSIEGGVCTWDVRPELSIEMEPNYPTTASNETYDWSTVQRVKILGVNGVR